MPTEEVDAGNGQKQLKAVKRKAQPKNEFDAGAVFDVKPAEEIELDTESSQYKAQQGQGGDRRA